MEANLGLEENSSPFPHFQQDIHTKKFTVMFAGTHLTEFRCQSQCFLTIISCLSVNSPDVGKVHLLLLSLATLLRKCALKQAVLEALDINPL